MRRKRLLAFTLSVIVLVTVLVLHTYGVTGTGKRMGFQSVEKGASSGHENSAYYIINDVDELAKVWNQHETIMFPPQPLPEVDFSKHIIIAVFMGQCLTTGYGIEVKEIIDTGLLVVVKVEKTHPGKECVLGEMLTHPCHIVKTDKIDKHVLFHTTTKTGCG